MNDKKEMPWEVAIRELEAKTMVLGISGSNPNIGIIRSEIEYLRAKVEILEKQIEGGANDQRKN